MAPRLKVKVRACTTADMPLPGGEATGSRSLANWRTLPCGARSASYPHLYAVYGSRAVHVAALTRDVPDLGKTICAVSGALAAEVVFAVREEFAVTLGDILLRRSMAGLRPGPRSPRLPAALPVAAKHLGWDGARLGAEAEAYLAEIAPSGDPVCAPGATCLPYRVTCDDCATVCRHDSGRVMQCTAADKRLLVWAWGRGLLMAAARAG